MLSLGIGLLLSIFSFNLLTFPHFMLCDVLFNESIKELGGVFVSKIVVKLSFMWLDNISFIRTCAIGK